MKNLKYLFAFVILLSGLSFGQGGTASGIRHGSVLPGTCQNQVFSVDGDGVYFCGNTPNVWTKGASGDASTLEGGKTWEAPGTIGSTTPNTGAFTTLLAANTNNTVTVDGVNYAGIGQASVVWDSSTTYPICQEVSHSGNYIAAKVSTNVTPGTNKATWYPIPNATRPTQLDCAFYIAASQVNGTQGASLILGAETYLSGIGLVEPTVSSAGNPVVSIYGQGPGVSVIKQNSTLLAGSGGDGFPVLYQPESLINFALARFVWEGFTVDANGLASAVVEVHGSQQSVMRNLDLRNAANGSDHYIEFGETSGSTKGWVFEMTIDNIDLGYSLGHGVGAVLSTSVSGGVPTITVSNGGSNYNLLTPLVLLLGTRSNGDTPCSSMGTTTPTIVAGVITAVTTTATGCDTTNTYAMVYNGTDVSYGFRFSNMSDSHFISGLTPGGVGNVAGVLVANISSMNTFYKTHPVNTVIGIQNWGNNVYIGTQIDTVTRYGVDFEGGGLTANLYGTAFEWNNANQLGSSDYHFGYTSNPPSSAPYAINLFGDQCGNAALQAGYNHFVSANGAIDATSVGLPSFVHVYETVYCNQMSSIANTPDFLGTSFDWSSGEYGHVWKFGMDSGGGGTPLLTLTNPSLTSGASQGLFTWLYSNPTVATVSQNYNSPRVQDFGTYWDGAVSQAFGVQQQLTFAAGSNPVATYSFATSGTVPTGGFFYQFNQPIKSTVATGTAPFTVASTTQVANLQSATAGNLAAAALLPNGTTATTQTAGDATANVATDAFVSTAVAGSISANAEQVIAGPSAYGAAPASATARALTANDLPIQSASAIDNSIVASAVTSGQPSFLGTSTTNVSVSGGTTSLVMWIGGQYQVLSSNVNVAVATSPVGEYFVFAKQDLTNAAMVVGDFITSNIAPLISLTAPTCSALATSSNPHYWFDLGTGLMKICTSNGGAFTVGTPAILIGVADMNSGGTAVDQAVPMPFGASPGNIVRLFGSGEDGAFSFTDGATHTKDGLYQVTSCFLANASTLVKHSAQSVANNTPGFQIVSQTPCMIINSAGITLDGLGGAVKTGGTGIGVAGNQAGFGGGGGAGGAAVGTAGIAGGGRALWYIQSNGGGGSAPALNTNCAAGCNGANAIGGSLVLNAIPKPNCFEPYLGMGAGGGSGTGDGTNNGGSSGAGGGYACIQAPSILVAGSASISALGTTPATPGAGIVGGGGAGAGGIIVENYGAIYGANIPTSTNVLGGTGAAGLGTCGGSTCHGGNGGNGLVITRKII